MRGSGSSGRGFRRARGGPSCSLLPYGGWYLKCRIRRWCPTKTTSPARHPSPPRPARRSSPRAPRSRGAGEHLYRLLIRRRNGQSSTLLLMGLYRCMPALPKERRHSLVSPAFTVRLGPAPLSQRCGPARAPGRSTVRGAAPSCVSPSGLLHIPFPRIGA